MNKAAIPVFASPLPFSNARIQRAAAPGSTIQQIIDDICPERLIGAVGAVAMINGQIVPQEFWRSVRPKLGTTVNINIVPQGGGGKKNPIASILSIAVLIAAPYAGAALAGAMGITSTIGISLVTGAVGVLGKLAVSALAPPPKPSNAGNANSSNASESPTQFIEGARNDINLYGVVPICLGRNRMFPLQAAQPYTETQDNDQYVRQLFTWGYGPKGVLTDLKIGETPIEQFSDFEIEHKLEGDLNTTTLLYPNDVKQTDYNILLKQVDGYTVRSTESGIDEASVDVTFPKGLAFFNKEGKRVSGNVQLELQYAPFGTPADSPLWSPGASSYKAFPANDLAFAPATVVGFNLQTAMGYRKDLVVVDIYSGSIYVVKGAQIGSTAGNAKAPALPANAVRISTVTVWTRYSSPGSSTRITSIVSATDDRDPALVGGTFQTSADFAPSVTGANSLHISGGSITVNQLNITASQTEALRRSVRVVFPTNGKYDFRIRRLSLDNDSDQFLNDVYFTAIRSVKYGAPVKLANLNGTAIRIKATDQLNGALDQLNGIFSLVIPDYNSDTGLWEERVTSNPASIYRYALQGEANAKPLADSKIDIAGLEDWHIHCEQQGYSYNRVIDYETSLEDVLQDIASAGSASPAIVDGKRSVAIDRIKNDIVQIITPRNSRDYSAELIYADLPHALRVQFRNEEKGFQQDERIVYRDGYNEDGSNGLIPATDFEVLELMHCTNSDFAFKTGKRHFAAIVLRPESHSVVMDFENLVAIRGDRVKLAHDIPLIAVGDGRIKSFAVDGSGKITSITFDDTVAIPSASTFYMRLRLSDGSQMYKQLNTSVGETKTFVFTTPFDRPLSIDDNSILPLIGDLGYIVEAGGEVDVILTRIEPQDDLSAKLTAIDYAPEIFTAENSPIPVWNSRITEPLVFKRPVPPELITIQSDESVMLRNSDGSFTPRAIITLKNNNEENILTSVKVRVSGTDKLNNANVLESTPERIILTGLDDDTLYDIHIRYYRAGGSMQSLPLEINGYKFIGASGLPDDVTGFVVDISDNTAIFEWNPSQAIDIRGARVRYSSQFIGATWDTAQLLKDLVTENRFSTPFLPGTYLIKFVDLSGNESANATAVITYDPGNLLNAIAVLDEAPDFTGAKTNTTYVDGGVVLNDVDTAEGYYYFANSLDLGALFTSFVGASVIANGVFINNIFSVADIFAMADVFGAGGNDLLSEDDIFSLSDVFGIGSDAWEVQLQYRVTTDDPALNNWSDWAEFRAGNISFWAIQFRIKLTSLQYGISPKVSGLAVSIDMPDRIEKIEDVTIPVEGLALTFVPAFKEIPAISTTIQDGDAADELEYTEKSPSTFTVKVYNRISLTYVSRTADIIIAGYGRERT